ncbi:MAG: HepT-like ribonuclease domain-containing protein [Methanomicrobiales archaeon]
MDLEIKKWLKDIELAISEINSFFPEKKIFSEFQSDVKSRKAVERNIEIIGEALSRILKLKPDIMISDARKIVDTRNRIIHGYDSVSADVIWLIVIRHIPVLEKEIKKLLD